MSSRSRLRPLQTCRVSFMAIAHSVYSRTQDFDGPLGSIRRMVWMAKLLSPLVFALQYQWLLILSFVDDRILAIENIVEKVYPPSRFVFDKIDEFLHLIETVPGKFEDAVNKSPRFNQVRFLDLALVHAISLLKFLLTILMNWRGEGTREKEILIDINCNERYNGYESANKSDAKRCFEGTVSSVCEVRHAEAGTIVGEVKSNLMKGTYKEVLEMGTKAVEANEICKENEKQTYKGVLEKGTYKDVLEKETYKDVLEKGTRETVKEKEHGKNNEKDTCKEVEKGIKVEDRDGKNVETIQSQKAKMECREKAKGKQETADDNEEQVKECSEGKDEKENKGKQETADDNEEKVKECSEEKNGKENKEKEENADDNEEKVKECSEEKNEKESKEREEIAENPKDEKEKVKAGNVGEEEGGVSDHKHEEANNESSENGDEILELFESAWLMAPRSKSKRNVLPF